MDAVHKDLHNRKEEIRKEMQTIFKSNLRITDWDVPEADDKEAAEILLTILQKALDEVKADVANGVYDYY